MLLQRLIRHHISDFICDVRHKISYFGVRVGLLCVIAERSILILLSLHAVNVTYFYIMGFTVCIDLDIDVYLVLAASIDLRVIDACRCRPTCLTEMETSHFNALLGEPHSHIARSTSSFYSSWAPNCER